MIFGYIDPGTGFTITTVGGLLLAFLSGVFGVILVFIKKIFKFLKKHFPFILLLLLLLGLVSGGLWLYTMNQSKSSFDKKIVILGLDALSPNIIEPLMDEGRLPHFTRLRSTGGYKHLGTTTPPQSPVAWSSFSTGQNPGKNGIFDFIQRNPKDYSISLSLSAFENGKPKPVIKSPRFWQYTSKKNIPAVILGCPVTFPPDKITGKMLSGMGVPDILGTEGTFTFYTSQGPVESRDTGGQVVHVKKSSLILTHLIGPKVARSGGKAENAKVPLKISLMSESEVLVEYQGKKEKLTTGQWSPWQEITFDLGLFRKVKGIAKFYLVEAEPHLKLYLGPINLDPRAPFFPISHPKGYSKALAEDLGLFHTQGMPFDTWALNEKRIEEKAFLEQVEEVLAEREKMLELELSRFENGIFYFYFESPDIIQHMFWRYIDERHPLYERDAPQDYKNKINQWYEKMDAVLGSVMAKLNEGDTLIVMSDHGFGTFRRAAHVNTWLRDNGYLELEDASALSGKPLLSGVDWSKTKAYAIGFNAVYINEKGREAKGIVNPGSEKENLKQEIIAKLESWADKKYNTKVVHKAYSQEKVLWGPFESEAPDIFIGFNTGYRASWQTALGDVPKDVMEDNLRKWSGSHLFDASLVPGVVFSNKPITKENPAILDIAPTVLSLTGFSEEEMKAFELDGESLFE